MKILKSLAIDMEAKIEENWNERNLMKINVKETKLS